MKSCCRHALDALHGLAVKIPQRQDGERALDFAASHCANGRLCKPYRCGNLGLRVASALDL